MERASATFDLDLAVLRAARAQAVRTGKQDSEVVEDALREYLGLALLDRIWENADLSEEEALELASAELSQLRARTDRGSATLRADLP